MPINHTCPLPAWWYCCTIKNIVMCTATGSGNSLLIWLQTGLVLRYGRGTLLPVLVRRV
ncbi:hypothetical protein TELCIR_05291 [Teladorsagia circumcincta]|uniref:Uncharacterized protein n=1 Tax=Teladorsagia circumcincta TaxID=45464 RepID=A0A2G9URI4_TELCI|nr:hypothetical protein TELCIR_05291 [Teladorsagia circumcincta]